MNAREQLDEFAEMIGINKNQFIGWSIAADFAEWYAEQVKNCSIPNVVEQNDDNDSKRDKLAEKIVSDLIRTGRYINYPEALAASAYKIASAMLKESEYYRAKNK